MSNKTILISGGCDPLTCGHIALIEEAAKYGNVVWALNSDAWLKAKKGYAFMKWEERASILRAIRNIHSVIPVGDYDGSVNEAIVLLKPDYFGHGGKAYPIPEEAVCKELGVELVWELGKSVQFSSGDMVDCMINNLIDRIEPHFRK
jgi:glycerol-3-phosphate cytidylyltransferase-like family protein